MKKETQKNAGKAKQDSKKPPVTAAGNSAGAGKRGTQAKAGSAGKKPAPAPNRGKGQASRSNNVAKNRSQQAAQTPGANTGEQEQKESIFKRLIEALKRLIGYKKGERDEFRYNYEEHHPGYDFYEDDDVVVSFGLTHHEETFGIKNMPLEKNPDPNDSDPSYIRNGTIVTKKKKNISRNKKTGWVLAPKDKANVKSKKRNYKKVAREQKKQNENKKSK